MVFQTFLKNPERFLFHLSASLFPNWEYPPHGWGSCLLINYGIGGSTVIKYPADFEFPLFRDKGGIPEYP
jgi:hypothetical protein